MKRWLLLLLLLQAGCASLAERSVREAPPPLAPQNWQQLESTLKTGPPALLQAIHLDAEARLAPAAAQNRPVAEARETARQILLDLLDHTHNPVLQADDGFLAIQALVSGGQVQSDHSFAAVLTDYLLQPDFRCRQPIYGRYFQQRYSWAATGQPCRAEVPFMVATRLDGAQLLWLDPKRVSAIHLLLGGNGQNMASRFGHVALRLVICPEGQDSEDACNSNLFGHLVLGVMARVDEFELNTLKALQGEYKAYLFASAFMDVYQDYAISEFRDVYSLPLQLDREQREQMVRELAELHWRFSSDYNFFTKNCASLLQEALMVVLPGYTQDDGLASKYMRPDHFFAAVRKSSVADGAKLASLEQAEQEGYFFSSTKPFYDKALLVVRKAMTQPTFADIQDYFAVNPVLRMKNIVDDEKYYTQLGQDEYVFGAQLMLEELAISRNERHFLAETARYFQRQDFAAEAGAIHAQLDTEQQQIFDECLLQPVKQISEPILRLDGIPDEKTSPLPITPSAVCDTPEGREKLSNIIERITGADLEQWQGVMNAAHLWDASFKNVISLKEIRGSGRGGD